ncbi:hypothetical protein AUK40_05055 [Candidatus Wirthbacteria bacterium CG2_30_54_11]|uniref:Uncharacterized protein n=1 Tax=Candidatus Wirthbacteria bacterium CG2_30_54_11 TaxID=1817892 RepID=A0A1J5ITC7_9BACT|nr:MAG: hypothetical protein AUK40_05055 [Candidatus Wirthbacteria bacterium CG2_30_54_11]
MPTEKEKHGQGFNLEFDVHDFAALSHVDIPLADQLSSPGLWWDTIGELDQDDTTPHTSAGFCSISDNEALWAVRYYQRDGREATNFHIAGHWDIPDAEQEAAAAEIQLSVLVDENGQIRQINKYERLTSGQVIQTELDLQYKRWNGESLEVVSTRDHELADRIGILLAETQDRLRPSRDITSDGIGMKEHLKMAFFGKTISPGYTLAPSEIADDPHRSNIFTDIAKPRQRLQLAEKTKETLKNAPAILEWLMDALSQDPPPTPDQAIAYAFSFDEDGKPRVRGGLLKAGGDGHDDESKINLIHVCSVLDAVHRMPPRARREFAAYF